MISNISTTTNIEHFLVAEKKGSLYIVVVPYPLCRSEGWSGASLILQLCVCHHFEQIEDCLFLWKSSIEDNEDH